VLELSSIVCMDPLRLGGLGGKKSTPSVGSEVPVRPHQLASGSWLECARDNDFRAFTFGYGTHVYICIEW
jgi:hypothetical protein